MYCGASAAHWRTFVKSDESSKKQLTDSKRDSSPQTHESRHSSLRLPPASDEIDWGLVSTRELIKALKKRCDGLILITYEHNNGEDYEGDFSYHGSKTILRGLRDTLMDDLARFFGELPSYDDEETA